MTENHHSLETDKAERKTHYRAIFAMKNKLGLSDDDYRALMLKATDKDSLRAMSVKQVEGFRSHLSHLSASIRYTPTTPKGPKKASIGGGAGPQIAQLRALWISAYHLGIVIDPADSALLAYCQRQTMGKGAETGALQWFTVEEYQKCAESLKKWLSRTCAISWNGNPRLQVIAAQYRILGKPMPAGLSQKSAKELDLHIRAMGAQLRKLQPRRIASHDTTTGKSRA